MFNLSAVMGNLANFANHQASLKMGAIIAEMMAKVNRGS
jgi:hypothetical protein